jgi:uncharacterized circularly permuted ATP-grasp superfamily protein
MENPEERELVLPIWKTWSLKKQTEAVAMEWLWEKSNRKELDDAKIAIAKNGIFCTTYHSTQYSTLFIDGELKLRHVDLRPYALCGPNG